MFSFPGWRDRSGWAGGSRASRIVVLAPGRDVHVRGGWLDADEGNGDGLGDYLLRGIACRIHGCYQIGLRDWG